jgi:arylsulfatase A-like enzyme
MSLSRRSALGALCGAGAAAAMQQNQPRPNVILILTDDLGYADLGCFGAKDIRTPAIDQLARQGVRFTQFYSNGSVCTPTRAALMTGRYQQRVGLEWALGTAYRGYGLETKETSLPRMLKDAGYATAMYGKWHLGFEPEYGPNAHGFDDFAGLLGGNVDHYSHRAIDGSDDWYENTKPVKQDGYSTDIISDKAVEYLAKRSAAPDQPFFLYLAYNAVHWPFQAPGRPNDVRDRRTWFDGTRADYAKMVESIDRGIAKIVATLDKSRFSSNTLILFTNDNGGERLSSNQPFFHHKQTLWEGGIRVPAIAHWSGRLPAGKICTQVAASMDFTASILGACGVKPPAGRTLDGIDIFPIARGEKPQIDRTLCWRVDRTERKQKAIRKGRYKYVNDGNVDSLYDLERDPGERVDLGYQMQTLVAELKKDLADWEADIAKAPPRTVVK